MQRPEQLSAMFNILWQMLGLYREIFWMAIGATCQNIIWLDDVCGKCGLFRGLESIIRGGDYCLCRNGNGDNDTGGHQFDIVMPFRSLSIFNLHKSPFSGCFLSLQNF